jgi:yeast amino acid transporter
MAHQGESIKYLPFRACFGVFGSYVGLILNIMCVAAQLYLACSPISGKLTFMTWLSDFIAVPIILVFFVVWKVWKDRGGWVKLKDIDLASGRKDNWLQAHLEDAKERATWGFWTRVGHFFC